MKKLIKHIHGDDWDVAIGILLILGLIAVLIVMFTMGATSLINTILK